MSILPLKPQEQSPLLPAAQVKKLTIDELSSVRHLHASAIRCLGASQLTEDETTAFAQHVYSAQNARQMSEAAYAGRLLAVMLPGSADLLATAGWLPANDANATARLIGVFVAPLFGGQGFGRLVVQAARKQALAAGYSRCTVRCPVGVAGFFSRLEFETASHGIWPMGGGVSLPVAFMRSQSPDGISAN